MPGIAGVVSQRPLTDARRLVHEMLSSMYHEPFYSAGTYSVRPLNAVVGWVAFHRTTNARQPIFNKQRNLSLVLSGECFTHSTCPPHAGGQKGLHPGHILELYEERGDEAFPQLNGLFSGLLIDHRAVKATLFNDRFGMERLYYHNDDGDFYFASEAKALLAVLSGLRTFDREGLAQLLTFGSTAGDRTLFRNVSLMPPASRWTFQGGTWQTSRYFSESSWTTLPSLPDDLFASRLHRTMTEIVPRYIETDAPTGISLTGGLDTRMIMASLPKDSARFVSYTFAGSDGDTLDVRLARRIASVRGMRHEVLRIGTDFFTNFAALAEKSVYISDGYLAVTGAHEIYLNRAARDLSHTRLTGNFGSEVLRGTTTFKRLGLTRRLFAAEFLGSLGAARDISAVEPGTHPVSFAVFREIPWHLHGSLKVAQSQVLTRTPYLDNDVLTLAFQAPLRLLRSRQPALSLIRHYPDLADIPTDQGPVRNALGAVTAIRAFSSKASFKLDYWCNDALPKTLLFADRGLARLARLLPFSAHRYLTYRRWFGKELASNVRDTLCDRHTAEIGIWNRPFLRTLADEHVRHRNNYVNEISAVLTVAAIERVLLKQPALRPMINFSDTSTDATLPLTETLLDARRNG